MLVIVHNVRSAHNVGSIFRTADAVGIEKIYLTGYTAKPIDRFGKQSQKLVKVSLGAENSLDWSYRKQIGPLIQKIKKSGFNIFALEQSPKSVPLHKIKLKAAQKNHTVLLIGNEVQGLSSPLLEKADKIIEIPMHGKKESLNVSVAFGIAVYWLNILT